jgi:AraC family transcriptional activator FtrA
VQQIFGRRISSLASVTGESESPYEVVLCGEDPQYTLTHGSNPGELAPLSTTSTADTVIVPGVEEPLTSRSSCLLSNLRAAHDAGARIVSFCGGAFVLGFAGILDGRRATTHWIFAEEFHQAFPKVTLEIEHLYVDDGSVHTSGGMLSCVDLALHLLALDLGQSYANDFGRTLVSLPHRQGGQAPFLKDSMRVDHEPAAGSMLHWMREHIHEPLTLAQLAANEHMSERSLIRKFRRETGMSVLDWITRQRVDRAKDLLETTDLPVARIAAMVGYGSTETLRRNFDKLVGTTAASYRAAFRGGPRAARMTETDAAWQDLRTP